MAVPWQELSVGVAAVVAFTLTTGRFIRHVEHKDDAFTDFLGNHLGKNTQALEKLVGAVDDLVMAVDDLGEKRRAASRSVPARRRR